MTYNTVNNVRSKLLAENKQNQFVGHWNADVPGAPDESLIIITASEVYFPNGGGDFVKSKYTVKNG